MKQEVYFENIREHIIKHIQEAKHEIKIAVAWFTDEIIIKELLKKKYRGVEITIIIYNDHINKKDLFKALYYEGTKIYLSKKLMHNKFCIIDKSVVLNGSFNWTINANYNSENVQITYNNSPLTKKFNDEFENLKKNCVFIDNHFDFSIEGLQKIDNSFRYFKHRRWKPQIPYFMDFRDINVSIINKNFYKIPLKTYLILNKEVEERMLWYYYLLQSDFSIYKLFEIKSTKVELPQYFEIVFSNKKNGNLIEFINNEIVVLEYKRTWDYYKKSIYKINRKGDLMTEKIFFSENLDNQTFVKTGKDSFLINNEMKITKLKFDIEKVLNRNLFVFKENYKYGIFDRQEKIITSPTYSAFSVHNELLTLIELPLIKGNKTHNSLSFSPTVSGYGSPFTPTLDICAHEYIITINSVQKKGIRIISGNKKDEDDIFLFKSDENYKYQHIYTNLINLKVKDSSGNIVEIGNKLTFEDFLFLRDNYEKEYLYKEKVSYYYRKIMKEKQEKEKLALEKKNKKEGCYIATMVYGDYNHSEVIFLRNFRDTVLSKTSSGQRFVKWYYEHSPKFVKYVKKKPILNSFTSGVIYLLVFLLKIFFKR